MRNIDEKKFLVEMLAYCDNGEIREVTVPKESEISLDGQG